MSIDDLMFLLQHPQELTDKHTTELKEALQYAPYCASLRVLYLRSLYITNNLHYPHERKKTVLFAESPAALAEVVMAEKAEEKREDAPCEEKRELLPAPCGCSGGCELTDYLIIGAVILLVLSKGRSQKPDIALLIGLAFLLFNK